MGLFADQPDGFREIMLGHINRRWGQLYKLEKEDGERALKYLLMTNAGGAIATLSFLGASQVAIQMAGAKVALFCFLLGLLLVGAATAYQYHYIAKIFKCWKDDVEIFYANKISWEDLLQQDKQRAVAPKISYALPYGAFASFIVGCAAGAISLC